MRALIKMFPLLALLLSLPALAQVPESAPVSAPADSSAATAQPEAAPGAPSANTEIERLLSTLRDDASRAALMRNLEALVAAQRGASQPAAASGAPSATTPAAPTAAGTPATGTSATETPATGTPATAEPAAEPTTLLAPNTLGAQLLLGASQRLQSISESMVAAAEAATDVASIGRWVSDAARDPVTQTRVIDAAWKLLLLFGAGLLAEWLVRRGLLRWSNRLDAMAPPDGDVWTWMRRVPLVLARFLLDLVPLAAFAIVSYGMIGAVRPLPTTELVLLTANNAYLVLRVVMALARMLFSPASNHLRLVPCFDETAAYVIIWTRRIISLAIIGYAVAEAGLLFGLPWAAYDGILRFSALLVSLLLIIIILQNRGAVADVLRAPELKPGDQPDRMRRSLRVLRDRLAEVWHLVAILWLIALWGVWALEVRDGFERLLRVTLTTLLILGLAKLIDELLRRAISRGARIGPDLARRHPGLELRANRYLPMLKGMVSTVVLLVALVLLMEAWGIPALAWFARGQLGARLLASIASVALTLALALAVWEVANSAIARYLVRLSRDAQAARSARVRTLLPMLRTILSGTIIVFVGLNVLTEIGVNVAPLIAGAGVIGLAIGFGSQTLVRDVITGVFLLFEDAVAVGDVVSVGGLSGVVEQLSIRSIRLRALDGSVHIVPFSAVTTVTNMTRDFSMAVLDISVAYHEDTDRVVEVMKEVAAELRADPKFAPIVRDELEVMGVERLGDSGVVIRARIKGEPMARWSISREFNRRIKQRFDQLGIEIPFPHQKLVFEPNQRLVLDRSQPAGDTPDFPSATEGTIIRP